MGDWTGTPPTILAGDIPTGDDWKTILDELTAIGAAWSTWTPTLTNLTLGNGTVIATYRRVNKTVDFKFEFRNGSTSAVGTGPQFTLPVQPSSDFVASAGAFLGTGYLIDASGGARVAAPLYTSGSTITIQFWNATPANAGITATAPWTWTTSDILEVHGTYYTA